MDRRLKKIKRILNVQEQLHRMAEWRLASLQRKEEELLKEQSDLIEALNGDDLLQVAFVPVTARRLQTLAAETAHVARSKEEQAQVMHDRAMQVKRTERMIEDLTRHHRREVEKKGLLDILDVLSARKDASLP